MVGANVLDISALAAHDDSIIRKEIYQYTPYTATFDESSEIRIAIQSKDSYLLPCESYLYMQITSTTAGNHPAADDEIYFIRNYASFLFSDARYELNGDEIDRVRNVGRASTMKLIMASRVKQHGYFQFCKAYESTSPRQENVTTYDVVIPLSAWFGFCDDYRKIILNCKHELILNRARQSLDCIRGGNATVAGHATVAIALTKIEWKMPHITLSDRMKLSMMNYLAKNRDIVIQHRSMDMVEYPQLPQTTETIWSVKTVSQINKPRYVIVGLQTARNGVRVTDASKFDTCYVTGMRLLLNSQIFPYNMNELNIGGGIFAELYNIYSSIQSSYYNGTEPNHPFGLNAQNFQTSPLFIFDTSRADESLIDGSIDIRVEIKTRQNMPANTIAYCLIIYENSFKYSPFDGIVTRRI